jgi:hypothetical protein
MYNSDARYGSRTPSAEEIALADQWALEAGDRMLGSVFKEFGAVDLMVSWDHPTPCCNAEG